MLSGSPVAMSAEIGTLKVYQQGEWFGERGTQSIAYLCLCLRLPLSVSLSLLLSLSLSLSLSLFLFLSLCLFLTLSLRQDNSADTAVLRVRRRDCAE